ncbi:hypothetical protein F8M41_021141 [Gigaspora margarita]|uniref:Uncharacterized protein n=1 Tax=Gigaspora margarita TaxID=4874 RepID=A0A8H4EJ27_GIGMA|nr:hypothetical protein F8M41_021141 [Gigaspora margarita]
MLFGSTVQDSDSVSRFYSKLCKLARIAFRIEEIEKYKTEQLSGAYLYSTPKPILEQQFYSNEDIDRLIEERIASRENLALKKPKEISGYLLSQNPLALLKLI